VDRHADVREPVVDELAVGLDPVDVGVLLEADVHPLQHDGAVGARETVGLAVQRNWLVSAGAWSLEPVVPSGAET
jgi:hypothetical protein